MSDQPTREAVTTDPMEQIVERALCDANISYITDMGGANPSGLDFNLTTYGVEIEVKQFHSERIAEQMARAPNVIAAQGAKAVDLLATMLRALAPSATPEPAGNVVEAMARAMCEGVNGIGDFDENIEQRRSGWEAQARCALAALRAHPHLPDAAKQDGAGMA